MGPYFDAEFATAWVGGLFWDGRVPDLSTQAQQPFINPNEMNNTPTNGVFPPLASGVIPPSSFRRSRLSMKPNSHPPSALTPSRRYTVPQLYILICQTMAAYEQSGEVNQFSSKYDASKFGVPPGNLYTLSASEERGRQLYFGIGTKNAHCSECHSSSKFPPVLASDRRQGHLHHVLLRQHRRPEELPKPVLSEDRLHNQPPRM